MLIKSEDKRGFSLNEGKSADQARFFSTEVCSADFHQRSVTVVEFGSRPAKRARLLSDKDTSIKKDQVSSICTRDLAQENFLKESDGNVSGMPQRYQADEPMSENKSGVTNELRSRYAGLKVISSVHTSEHMEKNGNTKVPSVKISGAQDDARTSLHNHENIDRYAGSTKSLVQQDADDTVSTSVDDGLFVIQVRSPKSKQLLHGQKQGIDQEELRSCAASSQTTRKQDSRDNSETLLHCHEGGHIVGYCPHKSVIAEDDGKAKRDAEEVNSSVELSNILLVGADSEIDTCRDAGDRHVRIPNGGRGEMPEVNSSEIPKDYVRTRKPSSPSPVAIVGAASLRECDSSSKAEDAFNHLHLEGYDPRDESIIKRYVRRPHCRADSHGLTDMIGKSSGEGPGVNSSEIPKVYVRTRKQSSATQVATVEAAALQEYDGSSKSEDGLNRLHLEGEDPLGESIIKHYVRRPHSRADSHGPSNMTEKSSGLVMTSATNVNPCSPQAEHHKDMSARIETEGILNVFQRRSKTNPSKQDLRKIGNIALQEKPTEKHSVEACYDRADHQPRWLPEGWTLEIRIREGKKTPARIRDKYYHDQKSGQRFRSRNEVLQFLEYERLGRGRMASDGIDTSAQLQYKSPPLPTAPAERNGFQGSLSKSPSITQTILGSLAVPSPAFMHLHPARMKTTPARPTSVVSTAANGTAMTWGHVEGPNGPIQLPWGPHGGVVAAGTGQGEQGYKTVKNSVASLLDGGAANSSRILKSREGDRLPSGSPIPALESPSDQGDKEYRGKLILRLKRKQPDPDAGKGRSKRPMYEVVHVQRPPPSTSTPTQEGKSTFRERTVQDVPSIPVEEPTLVNDISYERYPTPPPSRALEQPKSMKLGLRNANISNHWGINQKPQQLEVVQQEPYTALGIPATAYTSGLQTMASYSANHTHVFLDPVENTIPLSWQYPFTTQAFTPITTALPTFGPFPSVKYPSVSGTFSIATTVPIPVFEHFPGVSSSMHVNATTTLLPCSENRSRDAVSDTELADGGPHIHKALAAPRPFTKVENSKLLLGLGRRLCKQVGLEHKLRDWSMQSRSLATGLEGKSLQQRVGCSKIRG